jgi:catechol 2,3-dioxygenase-like lactoylglutathione lyase family enzyme
MATLKLGSAKFKLDHLAIVVKDMDKALAFYSKAFGLKFEEVAQHDLPPDVIYKGKPSPYTMKVTFAHMGPVRLEMVQVVKGKCIYTDFLAKYGEGLHHLGFEVDDLEKEVANAKSQGLKMICFLKMVGIMAFAHFDATKTNGFRIELVQKDVRDRIMKKLAEGG